MPLCKRLACLLLLFVWCNTADAQGKSNADAKAVQGSSTATDPQFSEQWHRMTQDKDFVYTRENVQQTPKKDQFDENSASSSNALRNFLTSPFAGVLFKGLLVIFIIAIIYFVVKNISFRAAYRHKKPANAGDGKDAPLFEGSNWNALLEKAIVEKNTRMIIRYSFMGVLHLLQDHNLISYSDDKTNYDYYQELKQAGFKQPFKSLSRVYEYAWYGNYDINERSLEEYMSIFNQLRQQLHHK